ncbi:MAG: F0F1 ATP synthase subunit alpha [Candidatus Omnitrophica bacterium]|nr:F0F1 ATP synthase subunit alpha [Candidatus Omnitrophota bacterium]
MAMTRESAAPMKAGASFDVREVGHVVSVREFIVKVQGLPSCMNGQMIEFANGEQGMVMGFTEEHVLVLVFGNKAKVRAGDEVYSRGEPFTIPVGDGFIGRVVTSLGEATDGQGVIAADGRNPIFREAPGVMERAPVKDALETGIRIIDASFPIAKGQRQLIIGDQMTGKTTIITDTILNQHDKGVLCVYCAVGQSQSSFLKVLKLLRERGAMAYTVVVAGIASAPLGEQFLAPYAACALAEYFAAKGRDVFIGFDDLSKHAWAYRQLSLLLERSPGREAYPGDIFYIHSQMLERAGKFLPDLGGGTMTFMPIVGTIQGDITGYIQTNLISITDGQLYLNTALFQRGFKPAIDFGLSVSRIGNRAQCAAMRELTGKLRLEYLQYQELLRMTSMKADLSAEAEARLRRGEMITQLFTQLKAQPSPIAEQVIFLYAIRRGLLDSVPQAWQRFKREVHGWLREHHADILKEIQDKQALSTELKGRIDQAVGEYLRQASGESAETRPDQT